MGSVEDKIVAIKVYAHEGKFSLRFSDGRYFE